MEDWVFFRDANGGWQWERREGFLIVAVSRDRFADRHSCRENAMREGFDPRRHREVLMPTFGRNAEPLLSRACDAGAARATRVLIVDDEPDFRDSTATFLELHGFEVSLAAEGEEALALISSGVTPDVVLLDQRMPRLTGGETLRRLREQGGSMPAVLVSGMANVDALAAAQKFDAALPKPFDCRQLVTLINTLAENGVQRPSP